MIYFIYSFLTIILIIITYKNYIMSNQVVTIGYLKTFVNGVISVNTTKSDSYCPTYAELTGGTLVQNYSAGTNPTNYKPGIKIPSCTVGIGYTNDQLVIRQDLQLLWYVLQSVDVSASPTTISCCSGSSTLSTTAYFNLSTKKENATTTATTNTSTVVTASYSDDKSYTTINGSKITFSKNSVNYPSYTSAASRSTTVTSTYQYSGVTKTDTVTITQSANSVGSWTLISDTTTSISVSPSSMSFDSAGGSKSYSVTRYYTSYYERYDSCDTLIDTDTDSNSASVTPTGYNCTGGFTCTSSKVSCNTNTGSSRTGTLTVTWGGFSDTCSLSQGASQAGTTYGEPYNYDYYLYVTSPKTSVYCSGGTEQFTARYVTTWDYDWVTKDAAGNVTNSGTSSDSSSTDVTNSASWSTTRGSVSSKGLLTYGASTSDNRITYTVSATYNGYSDSSSVYQEGCSIAIPCMTIYYTVSGLDSPVTVYFKTNGTQEGSHTVSSQSNQSLCNIAEDTPIQVTCSDTEVTVGGDVEFIFKSGTTANISLTKSITPSTPTCNVPSGTFASDYDFRVDFSEAVTSDITVYIDEKDGNCNVVNSFEVTVSKGKKTGYGNNVLVQDHTFVTAAYFEITDVKPNSDTTYYYWGNGCEYDDSNNCTETPDLCTCGVISISVNPSSYEFTSSTESKTFSVTIVDNNCSGCTGGFKVYNSSGTYVTSGTSSFNLSNQSGTFTIKANDDTGKTCTLTTTAYVDNSCTCSVTNISVTPSSYEFTSSTENKTFSVTINDNNCSGCTGGFKVYNSSGTYVTSGTSSFRLSNQSGTFTIKANDDTRKTCTLTTTAYTAPASTCVIGETITSNGGNGSKITLGKGGTKTLTIYTKEDGMFNMVSVVPDIYDSELVTISNTASSQTEYHTTWVLTASNSKTGSTDITFRNGCGEYIVPFEVTAATCQTSITYNSITATVGTVGKCSTSATFTVTANGTKTNTNCTTATTSTTLTSSNYTVKYGKTNGSYTLDSIETNETNSEVTWYYKITASSTYGSKTVTGSFKQEKGNCTPIYVFKFNNPTGGFDSTSTETHIIHKPSYEPVGPTTTLTSTKDGSNVGYTMSSNVNWITTSTASTTCSWTISKNTSTSSRSGTITLTQSGSNKTLTISVIQGGAPATKTCNPLFLSYDDTSHKMTATFDEMVSSDVTISFKVNVNNSAIITDSIKISEGNNSNTKTLSTSQSITSTAGTSISISSINPSSDSEYEYNCDTDWEIIPSEATCDCSTVSISCNPSNSYTNGDSVSTIVTVNAGSNCSTRWKAYSSSGSYLGEGESGKSLSRTTTGSVIFRSDACSGKTTTWSISKPECAKPTIRLSGSGDAYMLQSYSETDEWCGTNPHISVSTNADYIGDGSDYTHYSPTTCSFEIANCAASITSFNLDSGGWILDNYSGLNSFGIGFTIRPDAIVNGTCELSGTFTYLMQGTPFSGTFTISIQFNG